MNQVLTQLAFPEVGYGTSIGEQYTSEPPFHPYSKVKTKKLNYYSISQTTVFNMSFLLSRFINTRNSTVLLER